MHLISREFFLLSNSETSLSEYQVPVCRAIHNFVQDRMSAWAVVFSSFLIRESRLRFTFFDLTIL